MPLSSIDFLSPKITLFYNGNNSHISHFGGFLSLIFIVILILSITIHILQIFEPKINSILIYEQNVDDIKYNQTISYSGINHFFQIYSRSDSGWFGDFDHKNIIIYGIKEASKMIYNNNIDLYKTEHWVYDKCENLIEINDYLFSDISKIIKNYTKSICLRFYYNPKEQKYFEIGNDEFIYPEIETNFISEKKYIYKINIEKCINESIFNNKLHYICNREEEINRYLDVYNDIFIYFADNKIMLKNYNFPFEKYFFSISSPIQKNSYFEDDIMFSPIKIKSNKNFFNSKKEDLAYILKDYYQNNKIINNNDTIIGVYNLFFKNTVIIYKLIYVTFLEVFAQIGGTIHLLYLFFQLFNYTNNHFVIIENTKKLFKINTGIESSSLEGQEIILDKMRHLSSQNFKLKLNNNVLNQDDLNLKFMKNIQGKSKSKLKYSNYDYGFVNKSSKKNLAAIPTITNSHRKKNNYVTKRTQTKYSNTFKQMGKQFTIKNKRKSYMSQGFLMKIKDYSAISKNQSIFENDNNNDKISILNANDNNNSSVLLLKELKEKDFKEGLNKYDTKNYGECNSKRMKKKANLKRNVGTPIFEGAEAQQINTIKKMDPNIKGRHKSVNFGNQRGNFLFSANLLGIKNTFLGKNSSEYVNDSSKQINAPAKSPFQVHNSKFQTEKNKYDDAISRPSLFNNNENNLNTIIYNANAETASYLKTIIQSKLKLIIPDIKQDCTMVNFLDRKLEFIEFIKFFFACNKKTENSIYLISNFRNKLLSEEHIYKVFINLYLLEKIFEIDETYKFDINELYNNL